MYSNASHCEVANAENGSPALGSEGQSAVTHSLGEQYCRGKKKGAFTIHSFI